MVKYYKKKRAKRKNMYTYFLTISISCLINLTIMEYYFIIINRPMIQINIRYLIKTIIVKIN